MNISTPLLVLLVLIFSSCSNWSALVPPTVDEDPTLPSLTLNGTRFHLEAFGEPTDPLVIVLHGGPGADYRSLQGLRALADHGFRVILWDQRGSGLSQRVPCSELTAANFMGDLEAVIAQFTTSPSQPLFLVGHSWGAMYATWYVNTHPERVRSVVLAEPGGLTSDELAAFKAKGLTVGAFFDEGFNDLVWAGSLVTPDDHARADSQYYNGNAIASDLMGQDRQHPEPFWRWGAIVDGCLEDSAGPFDWTTHLADFQGDALFVHGEKNQAMSLEHQTALAAHYPRSSVVTIPNVGHDMTSAAPEAFFTLVLNHLEAGLRGAP